MKVLILKTTGEIIIKSTEGQDAEDLRYNLDFDWANSCRSKLDNIHIIYEDGRVDNLEENQLTKYLTNTTVFGDCIIYKAVKGVLESLSNEDIYNILILVSNDEKRG